MNKPEWETTGLYDVSIWWGDADGWHRTAAGVKKWTLRRVLRRLYVRSWDSVSILIEQTYRKVAT